MHQAARTGHLRAGRRRALPQLPADRPLEAILSQRVVDTLPLKVLDGVGPAGADWDDVIGDVAWTIATGGAVGRTGTLALELRTDTAGTLRRGHGCRGQHSGEEDQDRPHGGHHAMSTSSTAAA